MPYRLTDYSRALRTWGIDVEACGGRHPFKAIRGGDSFPFKAHNGMRSEISDRYISALCERFGIDIAEFKKKLSE